MTTFLIILSIALAVLSRGSVDAGVRSICTTSRAERAHSLRMQRIRYQAKMMLVFLAWLTSASLHLAGCSVMGISYLPESASEHGVHLDNLLDFNFAIITVVFAITHVFLFYFAFQIRVSTKTERLTTTRTAINWSFCGLRFLPSFLR